jgi:hypothetical protein
VIDSPATNVLIAVDWRSRLAVPLLPVLDKAEPARDEESESCGPLC